MNNISKDTAIGMLKKHMKKHPAYMNSSDLITWARNTKIITKSIFGSGSEQFNEITPLADKLITQGKIGYKRGMGRKMFSILNSFIFEIQELWTDKQKGESNKILKEESKSIDKLKQVKSKDIFIVHGHDTGRMQMLARFLESIDMNPIILHERASSGATIIEKLEKYSNVSFAVVLLSPDDVGSIASDKKNLHPRARQNVILELGYFLGKLGRKRTCALLVEGVEIPSDYSGVLYISMDSSGGWKFHLAKELKAAGLPIDLNKLT